jgi:hypothetical protein
MRLNILGINVDRSRHGYGVVMESGEAGGARSAVTVINRVKN